MTRYYEHCSSSFVQSNLFLFLAKMICSEYNHTLSLYMYVAIAIVNVSFILLLVVFNKENLQKISCSIYLATFHITSFLQTYISLLFIALSTDYSMNRDSYNLSLCHFVIYMTLLSEYYSYFKQYLLLFL